jgi:hypothetical protein
MQDSHLERRRDDTVGAVVTIRDRIFRLSRHECQYEQAHWMLEIQVGPPGTTSRLQCWSARGIASLDTLCAPSQALQQCQ